MNEKSFLFGFLLWSIETTDAAVVVAPQKQPLPYGICIDITLCQKPFYQAICSQGLPICPSPSPVKTTTLHSATQPATIPTIKPATTHPITAHPRTTPPLPNTTNKVKTSPTVIQGSATPATKTIVPSKPTVIVKSTHISLPGKQVNVLTIQNNFKISFGKKSNVTQPGTNAGLL